MGKKVFILLPDSIGLRNFAFTNFNKIGKSKGYEITYWNDTSFDILSYGLKELKLESKKSNSLTSIYANIRKRIELNVFDKKFNERVYNTYNFKQSTNGLKNIAKKLFVDAMVLVHSNENGIEKIRDKIKKLERASSKYQYCKKQLEDHQPNFVFCTNQRHSQSISPILAAQDLGIPTATFIFSWDNLPKATTLLETDYYIVWSDYMKTELLKYLPYVNSNQVFVTGTPQFESHFDTNLLQTRETFFKTHNLELNRKYICYSGDDETTSPLDQFYLEDLAKSVIELNNKDYNLGIIYRKCPVDFTTRYDAILEKYKDVIVSINPIWRQIGKNWNEIIPSKEDFAMQYNVCEHSEFVANVASSMVFDFVAHKKSCLFFNYEQPQLKKGIRDIGQNYNYIHFRSMPSKNAALWSYDKKLLTQTVQDIIDGKISNVSEGEKWFQVITGNEPTKASNKIWEVFDKIIFK